MFHLVCYVCVNILNGLRSPSSLRNFHTVADSWIPYIGWTWIFYYIGVLYFSIWALIVGYSLPKHFVRPAFHAYLLMIITGNLTQLIFPARSPWPETPVPFQGFMHSYVSYDPYVCLPSMHVALSILPACLSLRAFQSPWIRTVSLVLAALITISTLTLKEHYFLDTLTGLMLGLAAYAFAHWCSRGSRYEASV